MDIRYNSVIHQRLQIFAQAANWQGLLDYLKSLSRSNFRTASYVLAERVLPTLAADDYWACFANIAMLDRKAFLVTFLKAAVVMYKEHKLDFSDSRFLDFAHSTASLDISLDRQKSLKIVLPILRTTAEVQMLLSAFCGTNYQKQLAHLLAADESLPCYHAAFLIMRRFDHDAETLQKIMLYVLKRSTPLSFNFVSITRAYFGVEKLAARFSLVLQPYELSRMEAGYDGFVSVMTKIK